MATISFDQIAPASPGACAYACSRLGLRVFPLIPGTKRPALKGWKDFATTDTEQIREWWTGDYAGYGVGIATGAGSGVWVLDIDMKNGLNGFDVFRGLIAEHGGDVEMFTRTMVVATPSGGAHLYFRWDGSAGSGGGVVTKSGCPVAGLDTRGVGGLVRAPGLDGYQIVPRGGVRRVGITAAPGWLTQLCLKQTQHAEGSSTVGETPTDGKARVLGTERTLDALGDAPAGTRNDELNRAAFRLGLRGEMTKDEAWAQCHTIMFSIGANDSVEAQRRTFESGWEGGVRKRDSIYAHEPHAESTTAPTKG